MAVTRILIHERGIYFEFVRSTVWSSILSSKSPAGGMLIAIGIGCRSVLGASAKAALPVLSKADLGIITTTKAEGRARVLIVHR